MNIETLVVTPFQQNARILYDLTTRRAAIVDPGGDVAKILGRVRELQLTIESVVLTHAHIDHAGGVKAVLRSQNDIQLYAHALEEEMRGTIQTQASYFGLSPNVFENCPEPDVYLEDGERIELAGTTAEILFTPGHSPGHVSLYFEDEEGGPVLIAGDAVFAGSIGRTDLPGGDHDLLLESIASKILVLPEQTRILSGHGPDTTVGAERRTNPFLQGIV